MGSCMTEENKAFLLDLFDLVELVGPRNLERKCQDNVESVEECMVDDPVFEQRLKEAALEVGSITICPQEGG